MTDHSRIGLEEYHHICQFYYKEARLLDERKFQQWLALLADDVAYSIPTRFSPVLDAAKRETEAVLNLEQEFGHGLEPPLRDDNFFTLSIRVMRSFKLNSWSDNPVLRTTRLVSNIEVCCDQAEPLVASQSDYVVYSNVLLASSRYGSDNTLYTLRRQDRLRVHEGSYKIASRKIMLDWNVITSASLGVFF